MSDKEIKEFLESMIEYKNELSYSEEKSLNLLLSVGVITHKQYESRMRKFKLNKLNKL